MFRQIFRFELQYRSRRPAFYIYFFTVLLLTAWGFANGDLPAAEKEFLNSPAVLANFQATMSLFLMLVSATFMGTPLYRDLEHDTKEYYLSYPITKAGYFWGRYLGSFSCVALIGAAVPIGAMLGSRLGPVFGWQSADRYEASPQWFYWQPYLTLMLPNLFFTSSLFFGLVAVFRNVKVIYSSGMFLFLGYIIGNFFLHNIQDVRVIYLSDPFNINGLRSETGGFSPERLNRHTVALTGLLLQNRLLWLSVGSIGLLLTWLRFNFERFFGGRQTRTPGGAPPRFTPDTTDRPAPHIHLRGNYYRKTLLNLTRIEL
ncbi:MAG TPA: hypothetical protein VNU70_03500, partial [Puia sp.]|nr:hypothetical protein [Puia sp.]